MALFKASKPILQAKPEIKRHKSRLVNIEGSIEMNQVFFRYHVKSNWILDQMSFDIKANEYVALVGSTGVGKTTLFRLLMGLETPTSGAIYFNNKDEAEIDIHAIRSQIGYFDQSEKLISGGILANIIGFEQFSEGAVWEILNTVGLAEEIKAMPMGIHTFVSESSDTISAGQKQKILLARTLIKRPKIFLLDNSNSVLDNSSQLNINAFLSKLTMTRIVITKRISTLKSVDRILVMSKGKIIESGRFEELLQLNGHFAKLYIRHGLPINS
jgi:ABC-type bacteriocin/lantibiotic exporter with double-glycine peptidase domain